jgi:hypothetical protein
VNDARAIIANPDIDIVIELIGGYGIARQLVMEAIEAGKHVVTANKALLAVHGTEIFAAAHRKGVMVAFEAAVAGGIPIIKALREALIGNHIISIHGIINGTSNYIRVDWFTPDGLGTWGDGRTVILGTTGTIELRKYLDVARQKTTDHLIVVDAKGEHHLELQGKVGFPYFGQLILDCLHGTETAMTQAHAFKAAELSIRAQLAAKNLTPATS